LLANFFDFAERNKSMMDYEQEVKKHKLVRKNKEFNIAKENTNILLLLLYLRMK